jgi:hypothetical protein
MLVELNISVWTANKIDKDASRKVADDNHAAADSGHFRKNLMAGSTLRKDIADYAAGCRMWHSTRTMPWADRGPRLLPTSLFFDYKTEANARETYFNNKVSEFLIAYPSLVQFVKASAIAGSYDDHNKEPRRQHLLSGPRNPVYVRRVDPSGLAFSISSHRYSYIGLLFSSYFIT